VERNILAFAHAIAQQALEGQKVLALGEIDTSVLARKRAALRVAD
jgi:hypothetical protein